jgi:hypothetical protein
MRLIYLWAFTVTAAWFDATRHHRRSLQDREDFVRSLQRGFGAQPQAGPNTQPVKPNARPSSEPFYQASLAIHGASGFSGWEYRTMSTRPQTTEKAHERQSAVRVADAVADFPADLPADLDGEISASPESTRSAPRAPRPLPAAPPTLAPAEQIDARAIWRQLQSDFALHQPAGSIDSVIQDSWVIAYEDGEFIIGIADAFRLDWVEKKLRNQIKRRLAVIMGRATVDVKFRVQPKPVVDPPHARATPLYDQVAVVQHADCEDAPLVAPRPMNPPVVAAAAVVELPARTVLNPRFLLERFVVGKSNRLAHAAALTVAEQPGAMNPVFFYGGVGLGKTHLLQAITARINATGLKALYCTSEEFTNDLVAAIRSQSTDAFRAKYRNVDVLAVDDIQFIGNKASTQEEFFHTFNFLHSAGKQIILAADRKPRDLAGVEDRLRNRFEGGNHGQGEWSPESPRDDPGWPEQAVWRRRRHAVGRCGPGCKSRRFRPAA